MLEVKQNFIYQLILSVKSAEAKNGKNCVSVCKVLTSQSQESGVRVSHAICNQHVHDHLSTHPQPSSRDQNLCSPLNLLLLGRTAEGTYIIAPPR